MVVSHRMDINYEMAQNIGTPEYILVELSKLDNSWVKYFVFSNPNTPTNVKISLKKELLEDVEFDDKLINKSIFQLIYQVIKSKFF